MEQQSKRIVITQVTTINAIGTSFTQTEECLHNPPQLTPVQSFQFHHLSQPVDCYRIRNLDPKEILGKKGLRNKDWATRLLLCALQSGFYPLLEETPEEQRPGLCIGTAFGSVESIGDFLSDSIENGVNSVNPQEFANTVINSPTGNANIRYGLRNLSSTVATGFNASLDAIIYACRYLRAGYGDWVLAGGLEEISYYSVLGCQRSGIISKRGVLQPFGTGSDGMVCGEGCAIMLLETAEHAEARSAQVIGEICGFGSAFEPCDTRGNCLNQGKGIRHSIESACHDADITPDSLGFVAAGANGIIAHDREEAANISAVLGDIPVTSYKGKTGECYGASPVLSMVCALADMKLRRITGINAEYDTLQEANIVRSGSIPLSLPRALIHSFSCDGNCGSIILSSK